MERSSYWRAAGLGALSGVRSAAAPAVVANVRARRDRGLITEPWLPPGLRVLLSFFGIGELVADKLPFAPPRTKPISLAARAASGAALGSTIARKGEAKFAPALLGAAAAVAATFASFRLRRFAIGRSELLGYATAFAEDALVLRAGTRLARSTPRG